MRTDKNVVLAKNPNKSFLLYFNILALNFRVSRRHSKLTSGTRINSSKYCIATKILLNFKQYKQQTVNKDKNKRNLGKVDKTKNSL